MIKKNKKPIKVNVEIESSAINAKTRKLKAKWTMEAQEDLSTMWNPEPDKKKSLKDKLLDSLVPAPDREKRDYPQKIAEDLADLLGKEFIKEIDAEVVRDIEKFGKKRKTK
jgi:hypothetical protein